MPANDTERIDPEAVFAAFAAAVPERRYPAVMIGAANGAAMHLAALAIPSLPQTFLRARAMLEGHEPERREGRPGGSHQPR